MRGRAGRRAPALVVLAAGLLATIAVGAADLVGLLPGVEQGSIAQRYQRRDTQPAPRLLVVAVDDKTFNDFDIRWPFPRHYHARVIDRLRAAGARVIAYDVQFTEQTTTAEDNALIRAVQRARPMVLGTAETNEDGGTNVLGGDALLRRIGARPAATNLPEGPGGVLQRVEHAHSGLDTFSTVVAGLAGRAPPASAYEHGGAWIDFHGPPGTIDHVSFSDVYHGLVPASRIRGRIVVVGVTAPTLQDLHATPTSDVPMSGAEIQANAIDTTLDGLPLRSVGTLGGLAIVFGLGFLPALLALRLRALIAVLAVPVIAVAYALLAQFAFDHGRILPVAMPLFALTLGTIATLSTGYAAETLRRASATRRNAELEAAVRERTAELRATQLELIHRLAYATESRDQETGLHLERISRMCERLGLALGMSATDAETLRHASLLHDVGKIAIPDAILLRPHALSTEDRALMRRHTTLGAQILAGSTSTLVQMAEQIARTHHERWDGSGYPEGLSGEEIPLVGRICAVCDVFDALLSARPYKPPWPLEDALAEMRRERGRHFDPAVLDAFLSIVHDFDRSLLGVAEAAPPEEDDAAVERADPAAARRG